MDKQILDLIKANGDNVDLSVVFEIAANELNINISNKPKGKTKGKGKNASNLSNAEIEKIANYLSDFEDIDAVIQKSLSVIPKNSKGTRKKEVDFASASTFEIYRTQSSAYPLLSKEKEAYLANKCASGDKKAEEILFNSNIRLVLYWASKYATNYPNVELDELIQDGMMGLLNAIKKFKYKKSRFSTYASIWIKQALNKSVATHTSSFSNSQYIISKYSKIKTFKENFIREYNRAPSDEEISKAFKYRLSSVKKINNMQIHTISLDAPCTDEDATALANIIPDDAVSTEDQIEREFLSEELNTAFKQLDEREAYVIKHRYGINGGEQRSLQEIGDNLGLTRERVRQVEQSALKKLKDISNIQELA